ncbi:hypothetical protein DSECCO2_519060 [anaerobic digester metagenome]
MFPHVYRIAGKGFDIGNNLCFYLLGSFFRCRVSALHQFSELFEPGQENAVCNRFCGLVFCAFGVHVPVLEVVPEVEDLKVFFFSVRQPFPVFAGSVCTCASAKHLPELDF